MHIERFDLKAFGRFSDASLNFGSEPGKLHLIYGSNESGKSTSLRAITAWLFGIDNRSTDAYLHAYADLRVGGKLVSTNYGTMECVRRKGVKRTLKTIDESADVDEKKLSKMLGGMDQETFLRGFGLDRQRLIEGGRDIMCGGGELGQILFSAGVGMRSLNEIVAALDQQKRAIFLAGGQNPELNKALSDLKKLRGELSSHVLSATELDRRGKQLDDAKQAAHKLRETRDELQTTLARADAFVKAMPLASRRRAITEQLDQLSGVPLIDENFRQRRRMAETDLRVAEEQNRFAQQRLIDLKQQLAEVHRNEKILLLGGRIRMLSDDVAVDEASQRELPGLQAQVAALKSALADLLDKLGKPADMNVSLLRPSDAICLKIDQLIEQHVRLEQTTQTNQQTITQLRDQLNVLLGTREEYEVTEPNKLAAALKAHANPQRLIDELARANTESKRLRKKAELAFSRLSGFRGNIEEATRLRLPLPGDIQSAGDDYVVASRQVSALNDKIEQIKTEQRELENRIERWSREVNVPTEDQLSDARSERDRQLTDVRKSCLDNPSDTGGMEVKIDSLENAILKADQMVDAMRASIEIVTKREQANSELIELQKRLETCNQDQIIATNAFEMAENHWHRMWSECMVDAGHPQSMQQWLGFFETFAEVVQQHAAATTTTEELVAQVEETSKAIGEALMECELESDKNVSQENLLVLHARAQQRLEALQTAYAKSVEAKREQQRLSAELEKHLREQCELQKKLDVWQDEWQQTIAKFTNEPDVSPARMRQILGTIHAAVEKHRSLETCEAKIHEIQRGREELRETLEELAGEAGLLTNNEASTVMDSSTNELPVPSSLDPPREARIAGRGWGEEKSESVTYLWTSPKLINRLQQTLDEASQAEKLYQSLGKQIERCQEEINGFASKIRECIATLDVLCREVACDAADELPALEQQSTYKKELTRELSQLENNLLMLSGGTELDIFAEQVLNSDKLALEQTMAKCRADLERSQSDWETAQQNVGALQKAYDEMDGGSRAAEINQEIQDLEAKSAKLARRYSVLAIQQSVLNQAIEAYREKNQGPILQRATEFFQKITRGRYQSLKPYLDDKNQRILLGIRQEGSKKTEVRANLMSEGTADALFLSLRLAGLEAHVKEHGPIPLIMDDVLVQFDDDRSAATLQVLCEVCQRTQVIFFTHHRHLIELVDKNLPTESFVVHHLEEV